MATTVTRISKRTRKTNQVIYKLHRAKPKKINNRKRIRLIGEKIKQNKTTMKDKLVKMPVDLFKQIEIMAKRENRSVNGQIVFMLKEQLNQ